MHEAEQVSLLTHHCAILFPLVVSEELASLLRSFRVAFDASLLCDSVQDVVHLGDWVCRLSLEYLYDDLRD